MFFKKKKSISGLRLDRVSGLVLGGVMARLQGDKELINILAFLLLIMARAKGILKVGISMRDSGDCGFVFWDFFSEIC
jgi:hypothetical protein